jgi:hypothetical protein
MRFSILDMPGLGGMCNTTLARNIYNVKTEITTLLRYAKKNMRYYIADLLVCHLVVRKHERQTEISVRETRRGNQ